MANFNIKSIDIASTTVVGTAISAVIAIILSVIFFVMTGISGGFGVASQMLVLVCFMIFGTIILSVYHIFAKTFLYNTLVTKLESIQISLFENKEIKKISVKSTSIMLTVIDTIMFIVYYLVGMFLLQVLFSVLYTIILMLTGNMILAYLLYNIIALMTDPLYIIVFIVLFAVVSIIKNLIYTFSYNLITEKVYGVLLKLSKDGDMTVIDSVNPINTGLVLGIVGLIFGIITGIIGLFATFNFVNFITSLIGGFVGTFICVVIVCYLYNVLAPKLGKIKVELTEV